MVFIDSLRFRLYLDDRCRRPGQRGDPSLTLASHTYAQGVMVKCAIFFPNWTPLVIISGALAVQRYGREVYNRCVTISFATPRTCFSTR